MKTFKRFLFPVLLLANAALLAQTKADDIPVGDLPASVKGVLESYVSILRTSKDLTEAGKRFVEIAGGTLVSDDGKSLRSSTEQFGLKKDFNDIKHYADPIRITRVAKLASNGQGYGASAIKGLIYKVWIDKKDPQLGMPAPVSILVPEGHETIKTPKVVNIGSF
ncbi:MAG: hypothetical protein JNM63_20185 [Spirochaetia bacterium]|nr:hypothetical protein [Spirochaetia bacterium]